MTPTPWQWQFPPIADPEDLPQQLEHVRCEAVEANAAYVSGETAWELAAELMDTIHAAETALRVLDMNELLLDAIKRYVIAKNDKRGYYGGGE